jgi:hypothetical protein
MIVSPLPDAIDVRIRGAFTPLRSLEPGKLEAVIDLADTVPGEKRYALAPGDINVPQEVEVIAIAPAEIRFVLDTIAEKTVPIVAEITGEPAPGAHLDEVVAEPRNARIIGPAKTLARIVTLPTDPVSVEGARDGLLRNDGAHAPGAGSAGARRTGGHRAGPDPAGGPTRADAPADTGPRQKGKDVKLFGTDGLRGKAGDFPLDPASVRLLGRELGKRLSGGRPVRVVVGGDTRESTPRIVADLAAGLAEGGCNVAPAGIITTPGVAELVLELGAAAGVAISASHNPYEDNGIKIFGPDGRKWPAEIPRGQLLARAWRPAADAAPPT